MGAAAGCSERGVPYDCACTVLTDFDDPSKHEMRICAPSPERAPAIARGCAQMGAPAPVEKCVCKGVEGGAECRGGECMEAPR